MSKFNKFLMSLNGKRVAIIGIGISHTPLIKLLAKNGAKVTAYDKNTNIDKSQFDGLDIDYCLGEDYLENLCGDYIFKTPGMRFDNPYIQKAISQGSVLTSEMEVFFDVCPCKIIAITGSDGKTTTTTLISEILKNNGYTVHIGGNIGNPLLCDADKMKENDICVVELSSFQLQTMNKCPNVAVITNITPNHLDMHKDMQEYIDAKCNIFKNQTKDDILVVNYDDEITNKYKSNGTTIYFSSHKNLNQGVYLDGDNIVLNTGTEHKIIMQKSDIALPGMHNVINYMTAICATYKLVDAQKIREVAQSFMGVEHRIEFTREFCGVKYYNDSIATSPTRAIAGLNSFDQKVILIAGGYDKKIPFEPLAPVISKNVKHLILTGATAEKIRDAVTQFDSTVKITICKEFEEAILKGRDIAEKGDIVIMSPACASFDMFENFAKRGNKFKEIVNEWR